ncbi:MAG: tetratricopeptide repeat protein [Deltaproteobacteria bacterium]|nr:tetratricopeptide repeat protein [Deltaproteobacteria bacterium]
MCQGTCRLNFLAREHLCLGEIYANNGQKEKALEHLNKALSMCQEMGIEYWPDKIQEVLDRL